MDYATDPTILGEPGPQPLIFLSNGCLQPTETCCICHQRKASWMGGGLKVQVDQRGLPNIFPDQRGAVVP